MEFYVSHKLSSFNLCTKEKLYVKEKNGVLTYETYTYLAIERDYYTTSSRQTQCKFSLQIIQFLLTRILKNLYGGVLYFTALLNSSGLSNLP